MGQVGSVGSGNGQSGVPGAMTGENPIPQPPASYARDEDRDRSSASANCPPYDSVPGLAVDGDGNPFIANIQLFLDTCPQRDPNLAEIQSDFQILRDWGQVTDFPCTEPVSQMPVAQYPDSLVWLQVFRTMYYMDRGQSGHLPWTPGTLYDWVKSGVGGVNIITGMVGGGCCQTIGGRVFFSAGAWNDFNREFDQAWEGISNVMTLAAHERRHRDGDGFPHSSCCGTTNGCDDNYDPDNLSPYGVQWWLQKAWLEGDINVGAGCLSADVIAQDAQWFLNAANYGRDRFCYTQPPLLTMPATPEGPCNPRQCTCPTIALSPTTLPNATFGSPYAETLKASGGTSPYAFTVTRGSLPTGLRLRSGGALAGTPTVTGTFTFTVRAKDTAGCAASHRYSLSVHEVRRHLQRER